jgi:hypothetical protein
MRLATVVLVLALGLPATALAKEVSRVDVCGAGGCGRITDHDSLMAFMAGDDMAAAAPREAQRSYRLKVFVRDDKGEPIQGWTSHWLPAAGLIAFEDAPDQYLFSPVGPKLERVLRDAARGHAPRAARSFGAKAEPVAQVDEVVEPPAATARADGGGGSPPYAWIGVAVGLLLVGGGAVRVRHR